MFLGIGSLISLSLFFSIATGWHSFLQETTRFSNEKCQFEVYEKFTRSSFDLRMFHNASASCLLDPKPLSCFKGMYWSKAWAFNIDGEISQRISRPIERRADRLSQLHSRSQDCSYWVEASKEFSYALLVKAICNFTELSGIPRGGSSFEFISMGQISGVLAPCDVMDRLDDSYIVSCAYSNSPKPSDHGRRHSRGYDECLIVHGWLSHEHFDAFTDGRTLDHGLPPLLTPLVDNYLLCPPLEHHLMPVETAANHAVAELPVISGRWVLARQNRSQLDGLHLARGQETAFTFRWWDRDGELHSKHINASAVKAHLERSRTKLHLYGSSHVRYLFNFLEMKVLGVPANRVTINRQNTDIRVDLGTMLVAATYFLPHIAQNVSALCDSLEADGSADGTKSHILALQFGAWDLRVSGLRRILLDSALGLKPLIRLFEQIMTSEKRCGNLQKLVLMTPMPYPMCTPLSKAGMAEQGNITGRVKAVLVDEELKCENDRGFRSSASLSALRSALLDEVRELWQIHGKNSKVQFVVADAHDIVKPMFFFDRQTVCINHVLCCRDLECVSSAAGGALIDAVLHAVMLNSRG